jgi:UDP-N-acetylmuramoyl-L-alanyl-D-glutamate--2,6-diaminopimelate ligase
MILKEIIQGLNFSRIIGDDNIVIRGLSQNSNEIKQGYVFFAKKGYSTDGHQFIPEAIEKGCRVVVCEYLPQNIDNNITYILSHDVPEVMGEMAHRFYGRPSEKLQVIGVTGTNGKTTTSTLLYQLFCATGIPAGLISTVKIIIDKQTIPAKLTTPDSISLHRTLKDMVDHGCKYCFMEVSSIGVDQKRIQGIRFKGGIFTNITHDHLDYHKTFENYLKAKQLFFTQLSEEAFALYNADDKNGKIMVQNSRAKKYSYAVKSPADFTCKIIDNTKDGLILRINQHEIHTRLVGRYNAYNLLATYATAILCGIEEWEVVKHLSNIRAAEGRFEIIRGKNNITGIVDYAHTPDALKNILDNLNELKQKGRIITVVGCGGNRDKEKRPLMGKIAAKLSDQAIFTSDNPRDENPADIIENMMSDLDPVNKKKVIVIEDRKQAIKTAVTLAQPGDIVLVAGKGHEDYQEIKGKRFPFNDSEILQNMLNE